MSITNEDFYSKLVIHEDCELDDSQVLSDDDGEIDKYIDRKILRELDNENLENIQNRDGPMKPGNKLDSFIKRMYEEKQHTEYTNVESTDTRINTETPICPGDKKPNTTDTGLADPKADPFNIDDLK
jgi:hypothetical protein